MPQTIVVMTGLSGSGKTEFVKKHIGGYFGRNFDLGARSHLGKEGPVVIDIKSLLSYLSGDLDDIYRVAEMSAEIALKSGRNVIVDGPHIRQEDRSPYIKMADRYKVRSAIVWVDCVISRGDFSHASEDERDLFVFNSHFEPPTKHDADIVKRIVRYNSNGLTSSFISEPLAEDYAEDTGAEASLRKIDSNVLDMVLRRIMDSAVDMERSFEAGQEADDKTYNSLSVEVKEYINYLYDTISLLQGGVYK